MANLKSTALAAFAAGAIAIALAADPPKQATTATIATAAQPAAGAAISAGDRHIMDQVVEVLNAEPSLKGSKIAVLSKNSQITLSGSVPGKAQADKAVEFVERMTARKVTNHLKVGG